MTSAEAREAARLEWGRDDVNPLNAFDAGWSRAVEYARGATVAEIVEWLGSDPPPFASREWCAQAAKRIEARFSPAPPCPSCGGPVTVVGPSNLGGDLIRCERCCAPLPEHPQGDER